MRPSCLWVCVSAAVVAASADFVPKTQLSDVEYEELPKLFTLERYDECLVRPNSAFCLASFHVSSPVPSPLYDRMKDVSRYERFNYNHTKLHRGVCVTRSCRQFLSAESLEQPELVSAFEACVNHSLNQEYGFEARLDELRYCKKSGEERPWSWSESLFVLVTALLLALNLAGTVYDIYIRRPDAPGIPWLMAFSVRISWEQITIIRKETEGDPRLHNLKPIQGVRVLTMFLVVMSHVIVIGMYRVPPDNPRFIEIAPYSVFSTILYNGQFVMQTFMVMASFLVCYNFLIYRETRNRFSWKLLWEAIVQRFIRLTPAYMYVISMTATFGGRWVQGPLCPVLEDERQVCRNKWWLHLFYIHNIVNASDICLPQSWYLGADFQLFIFGMTLLMVFWRWPSLTRPVLTLLLMFATALQFYLVYYLELRPSILMQSPEIVRNLYKDEPSFWIIHTTFQGNLQGYLLGIVFGFVYYKWEKEDYRLHEKQWFRAIYHAIVPFGFSWLFLGHFFMMRDEENRLHLALYAMVDRAVFALAVITLLYGNFKKIPSIYYSILSWNGWQAMGRLSYGVMLLHTGTFLNMMCTSQYPRAIGLYASMNDWFGNLVITYALAVPLALFVEYPLQRLQKVLLQGAPRQAGLERTGLKLNGDKHSSNGERSSISSHGDYTNGKKQQ